MRWKLITWITLLATYLSPILMRKRKQRFVFSAFGKMKEGTLGRVFYQTLQKQQIAYKPNLIRHDLNPNYALENLLRLKTAAKSDAVLRFLISP